MLLLLPPLSARFPSIQLSSPITRLQLSLQTSQCTAATAAAETSVDIERYSDRYGDQNDDQNDVLSLQKRRYDFTPLLNYLSHSNSAFDSDSDSVSPTSLDPIEFLLAEPYRAVPAPLWHSLLKSLYDSSSSSSSSSINLAYAVTLTPLTYNALINACARNNDLEKALNLMSRMRQDGYQSDFVNYSLIIQSLTRNNKIDSSFYRSLWGIESTAQAIGLSPKTATLVAVIYSLSCCGRIAEAEAVFEEMKGIGLKPRARAYNALLKGYMKEGSLKDAELVVSEMERSGVSPDEHTYSLLIDAYSNADRWESAIIVLKEMEANNVKPNSFVYGRILASYRSKGEWQRSFQYNCLDHAMATFDRMLSEGIEPDTVT
ncbi:Pentatricopeptide repeat-containing protein [Hibiscus syriacus]|uniref:Pentatricopeptide repeat-containing protein n=1 Tax=Hibiscus syriacus TaxID=106335 RepID=A0A6A2ZG12_HIBSY|nr:Pentatricopeptide repeat-containing protein [Hibiscus syriacus]